jgi:hypothetical protein
MKTLILIAVGGLFFLSGCAGTFNTAVHALPSVQNCHDVKYVRHGSDVDITAKCQIPTKSDPLLDIPVVP